jgi:hypothetical protein
MRGIKHPILLPAYLQRGSGRITVEGLILKPSNLEAGQFQRAGSFTVETYAILAFKMASKTPDYVVEESFYTNVAGTDEEGRNQCMITLI